MLATQPRKLQIYQHSNGREPFTEWFESRDQKTRSRIRTRLGRLESGYFIDCKSIGEGIFESRFHFGAGYRIYFGIVDNTIILLLCGGDKSSQTRDIERAKTYWQNYKETQR